MAMALALCNTTRPRLSDVNPVGAKYFIETLMIQIYEFFDEQELVDVTFKLSNPTALITAHRIVLAAASNYFRELLRGDNGISPVVEINEIDSDTFERLITYCYTGKTLITINNVDRMLKAALLLQLDVAVANCVDFLMEHITDFTLQHTYSLANEAQCEMLNEKIFEYETQNFMNVVEDNAFLSFDYTKLEAIIKSDHLDVKDEKDVFNAVKRWYEHDTAARKQYLPDLIACIRLTKFNTDFIMSNIYSLPGCHVLALEALAWSSHPSTRAQLSIKYTKPRWADISFLALNLEQGTISKYNKTEDLWLPWSDIKLYISSYQTILMDDNLLFIGGTRNDKAISEVVSWKFKTKTFKQLTSMNQPRYRHSVVVLNDKVYAMGGFAEDKTLKSVEMYSATEGWQLVNDMITPRRDAGAVALNGKIYVMGGRNPFHLKSVDCYDPITNCWTPCADMNDVHYCPGATVHNEHIFILGGGENSRESKTVERYDPQRNEWTKVCSLSIGRYGIASTSIYNQLWIVGGSYNENKDCVSVYDEQNDRWIDKRPVPVAGNYYCFTVPEDLLDFRFPRVS